MGLAYWDNGFKVMSANKPLKTPADFKGQKMRIQSSKVLESEMRSVGAIPQVMAFSEVYQALQTGVVDGTENPPSNLYTQKMHEVQKYVTLSDHGYLGYAVIVNKKFWDGLPADIRTILEGAMKDATKYANDVAKKDNDEALAAVKKSGRTQLITLTPAGARRLEKGDGQGPQGEHGPHRRRPCARKSTRKPATTRTSRQLHVRIGRCGLRSGLFIEHIQETCTMMKYLDHLEEIIITFLIGAATVIIFVAVAHRYLSGMPIPGLQDWLLTINMSWAQELCIYMFVWMAKFGAAYGVRTGIHVGVDVLVNRLPESWRIKCVLLGIAGGAIFTGLIGTLGATLRLGKRHALRRVQQARDGCRRPLRGPITPDLEWPTWIIYSAVPLGSYLMCFRFLQVGWTLFPHRRTAAPRSHPCRGDRGRRSSMQPKR